MIPDDPDGYLVCADCGGEATWEPCSSCEDGFIYDVLDTILDDWERSRSLCPVCMGAGGWAICDNECQKDIASEAKA